MTVMSPVRGEEGYCGEKEHDVLILTPGWRERGDKSGEVMVGEEERHLWCSSYRSTPSVLASCSSKLDPWSGLEISRSSSRILSLIAHSTFRTSMLTTRKAEVPGI